MTPLSNSLNLAHMFWYHLLEARAFTIVEKEKWPKPLNRPRIFHDVFAATRRARSIFFLTVTCNYKIGSCKQSTNTEEIQNTRGGWSDYVKLIQDIVLMEPIVHTYFDSDALEILAFDGAIMNNAYVKQMMEFQIYRIDRAGSFPSFKVMS